MAFEDRTPSSAERLLEEVETLTWALLDDQLMEADAQKLSQLLEGNQEARARYVECVQLHIDLRDHFAAPASQGETKASNVAILPNLLPEGMPGVESRPPVLE